MSLIDDRKRALENKFAHDQELKFKAEARRNKLLGQWAAELMGKEDREAYGLEVVVADIDQPGDDDVLRKIRRFQRCGRRPVRRGHPSEDGGTALRRARSGFRRLIQRWEGTILRRMPISIEVLQWQATTHTPS